MKADEFFVKDVKTVEQVIGEIADRIKPLVPSDAQCRKSDDDIYIRVERGWAIDGTVSIRFRSSFSNEGMIEGDDFSAYPAELVIEVGWSASSRSACQALAAVTIYRELIAIAALAEAATYGKFYDVIRKELVGEA